MKNWRIGGCSWRNKPNQIQSFLFENEKSWFDWLFAALLPFPQYEGWNGVSPSMEERWESEPGKKRKETNLWKRWSECSGMKEWVSPQRKEVKSINQPLIQLEWKRMKFFGMEIEWAGWLVWLNGAPSSSRLRGKWKNGINWWRRKGTPPNQLKKWISFTSFFNLFNWI